VRSPSFVDGDEWLYGRLLHRAPFTYENPPSQNLSAFWRYKPYDRSYKNL
jgi:hypothetical protein